MSVKDAGGTTLAGYSLDAAGRRITQADGSGTTTDLYYGGTQTCWKSGRARTVTSQNVWGIDYVNDLVLRDDNSTSGSLGITGSGLGRRLYAQHDANYNTTALTDASGDVQERFVYDPYGAVTVLTPSWAAATDLIGWEYVFQGMW